MEIQQFREWLKSNTAYSVDVITDIVSRLKRANKILQITENRNQYLEALNNTASFLCLSMYVKSQIRQAVKLYFEYKQEVINLAEKQ